MSAGDGDEGDSRKSFASRHTFGAGDMSVGALSGARHRTGLEETRPRDLAAPSSGATLGAVRAFLVAAAVAASLVVVAVAVPARTAHAAARCPASWAPGWQKLANRIQAPVYCPTWMPAPLDAKIGGPVADGYSVKRDRSYWVSFLSLDTGDEVHVNFRGYPGRTRVPTCVETQTLGNRTVSSKTPCFANAAGTVTVGAIHATLYTVNQDADQWHLLYAWRYRGSLYAVSEHVISRYDTAQVKRNLLKLMRGLVLVQPQKQS